MSHQATTWAFNVGSHPDEQPVGDTGRKFLLAAMADHAHADGTNAWASVGTYARYIERSERTVQRYLGELLADGFIRHGDQSLVAHLRGDRRPVVYDLAMSEPVRAAWSADWAAGHADDAPDARGDNLSPRPDGDDPTPVSPRQAARSDTGVTPSPVHGVTERAHGVTETPSRGDTRVTQTHEPKNLPPQPPAGGSPAKADTTNPAGCASCRGQRPCRACRTTPRTAEADELRAAAARRRRDDHAATQAARANRGRVLSDPAYATKLEAGATAARAAIAAATGRPS